MISKHKWFTGIFSREKIKCSEDLIIEDLLIYNCQTDLKWMNDFEQCKVEFETESCTNVEYVIAKMYKLFLKYKTEEQVNVKMG